MGEKEDCPWLSARSVFWARLLHNDEMVGLDEVHSSWRAVDPERASLEPLRSGRGPPLPCHTRLSASRNGLVCDSGLRSRLRAHPDPVDFAPTLRSGEDWEAGDY